MTRLKILIVEDFVSRVNTFKQIANYLPSDIEIVWKERYDDLPEDLTEYSLMLLDHDLEGDSFVDPKTSANNGTRFVDACKEGKYTFRPSMFFIVHSHNPARGDYMTATLRDTGLRAIYIPYYVFKSLFEKGIIEDPLVTGDSNCKITKEIVHDLAWKVQTPSKKGDQVAWLNKVIGNLFSKIARKSDTTQDEQAQEQ